MSSETDNGAKLVILQEYLEAVKPRIVNEDAVYLSDIMEVWSFACQVNNDGVMSSAAVVLALLLQVVSGSIQLVSHGLGVCQTILQERQLKSLSKNLSSEKGKGFVISPTLRLLNQAVCLDGGAFAKRVFRARASTLTALGRNLEVGHSGDSPEDAKKASVRTNAVKLFCSCLKYLHSDARKELLLQKELLSHLTFMIKDDPPHIVLEILHSLKEYVLKDDKLSRELKLKSFNTKTLMRVLGLYIYGSNARTEEEKNSVSVKAHDFLLYACTTPGAGVLYPSTGLYPKQTEEEFPHRRSGTITGLEGSMGEYKYSNGIPVYNFVLSEFVQKLRPWSSLKHSELLVAIFKAAPELIADYFFNNRSFTFEPKISMTWVGYAAFLFNTMQIPIPKSFGDHTRYGNGPPPTAILLDNIIPLPINQKVLIRCLSSKSSLTSFFATRLLIVALEKLSTALEMYQGGSRTNAAAWTEASRRLVDVLCQRIPDMKDVVRSYKSIPAENNLHKITTSHLLRLYYEVIPRVALAANFDVSPLFSDVLRNLDDENDNGEAKSFGFMELENIVSVASCSPGMRWYTKVDKISNSVSSLPFTALLRLLCADSQETPSRQIRKVLTTVAVESQLASKKTGLVPLIQALRCAAKHKEVSDIAPVWSFLDNCISRCASSPIKYLELLETYLGEIETSPEDANFTLLNVAIVEQLPFALSSMGDGEKKCLAKFLSLYFNAANQSNESSALVGVLYGKLRDQLISASLKVKELGSSSDAKALKEFKPEIDHEEISHPSSEKDNVFVDSSKLDELLQVLIPDNKDTSALTKWSAKNVEDLIEDEWAVRLIRLLLSQHLNIRKEAVLNILRMAAKFKESSYEEKDQVWLLLWEVAESSKPQVDAGPVPSAFTAFATHALDVLRNPLHPLYPKVNTYLTRSPVWSFDKLPLAHDILHGEPSEDDRYYTEITWLLTYLLDSLVTPSDLGVFHKKRWFEKILALGSNPYLRFNLRTRILRIVYRATCIEAGSTTLITRFGVMSWLDVQRAGCEVKEEAAVFAGVMRRVWETCDQGKIISWSRGGVLKLIESISQI